MWGLDTVLLVEADTQADCCKMGQKDIARVCGRRGPMELRQRAEIREDFLEKLAASLSEHRRREKLE